MQSNFHRASLLLALLLFAKTSLAAPAITVLAEVEPNDKPQEAVAFTAPVIISGELPVGDQDAYSWHISDADAQKPWDFTLHGMPGALTGVSIMRVLYGPDPNATEPTDEEVVTGYETLLTFGIRDGSRPVHKRNIFLPTGEFLIGLFGTGQAGGFRPPGAAKLDSALQGLDSPSSESEPSTPYTYKLHIEPSKLVPSFSRPTDNSKRESPSKLRIGSTYAVFGEKTGWYSFVLNEDQALSRWTISGAAMIENPLEVALFAADEKPIATARSDKYGHYTLPNLVLAAGTYSLKVTDQAQWPSVRTVLVEASGIVTDTSEQEPNDTWPLANRLAFEGAYTAKIDKASESDFFRFNVTEEQQGELFELVLDAPDISRVEVCLLNEYGVSRQCRSGRPPIKLDTLNLNAGEHGLKISRAAEAVPYTLTKSVVGLITSNSELEPNDQKHDASVFGEKRLIKGTLPPGDRDYFTLHTSSEAQLWRLQAIGTGLSDLIYHPNHGETVQSVRATPGSRRLRLDNLYLLPGKHQFSLNAREDTKYVLRALPLGQPSPHSEWESNDSRSRAQDLSLDVKMQGLITEASDVDYFRFHLPGEQQIKLSLKPPPQAVFRVMLYWDGGAIKDYRSISSDKPLEDVLQLQTGDYYAYVSSGPTTEVEYELQVSRVAEQKRIDLEPNDNPPHASPIPESAVVVGRVGVSHARRDLYQLGTSAGDRNISLSGEMGSGVSVYLLNDARSYVGKFVKSENGTWTSTVPVATQTYLAISGSGNYQLAVDLEGAPTPPPSTTALPIDITFVPGNRSVAAYREEYQHFDIGLELKNTSAEQIQIELEASTDNNKWAATLPVDLAIAPNETATATARIDVLPDAWPDEPVMLHLSVTDAGNRKTSATTELNAERLKELVNGRYDFALPKKLLGAVNVAAKNLGAVMVTKKKGSGLEKLHDGLNPIGEYFLTKRVAPGGSGEVLPLIDLAGDSPVDVIGFAFHPFGLQDGQPAQRNATKVMVELSLDGVTFEPALKVKLAAETVEQGFVLPAPKSAKFARLTLLDSYDEYVITLAEWKVLATLSSAGTLAQNIALPALGGQVVWSQPSLPNYGYLKTMLTPKEDASGLRARDGVSNEWAIGFNHNRAALIEQLQWRDKVEIGEKKYYEADVYVSLLSPAGPWQKIGTWTLKDTPAQEFKFPAGTWARFIRFHGKTHQTKGAYVYFPEQLTVIESREHGSIVGEWGQDSSAGPYELKHTRKPVQLAGPPQNTSKAKARALKSGQEAESRVRLAHYDNWYAVTVPQGQNVLLAEIAGEPTVAANPLLEDDAGNSIDWYSVEKEPGKNNYVAYVEPGEYFLKVIEPPRSVVFTWDTSGSTGQARPMIRQALMQYVQEVKPGLDEAHMLPFGGTFLSRRWIDHPYLLQSVHNEYNGAGDSSEAEAALVEAAEKLRSREGKKIIVIITDAATNDDSRLWQTLHEVRPKIIALGVSSKGAFGRNPPREQDLLQNWASSSNGYYENIENIGSVARAFDRASARIRVPAEYRISTQTDFRPEPEPGFLALTLEKGSTENPLALPKPAIEVILDASGSMLQRLEGKRRYQIAREVLSDLVASKLPDDVNFGLRVFGHKEAGSCRSDLELPIAPLQRKKILAKLKAITPKNLAKTPIADSLEAVAQDMKSVKGSKTIVLVTDGEETCGGDVAAAIVKLQESGVDAVINIVGFALADEALEAKFRSWATLGGGSYRSASDKNRLDESMQELTSLKFSVVDKDGAVLGEYYSAHKPVELPAGDYKLRIGNEPLRSVTIKPKTTTTVSVRYQ